MVSCANGFFPIFCKKKKKREKRDIELYYIFDVQWYIIYTLNVQNMPLPLTEEILLFILLITRNSHSDMINHEFVSAYDKLIQKLTRC